MESDRRNTQTGGRGASTGFIAGDYSLAVGMPSASPPDGWQWTKLTDLARLETGHTPSRKVPEYWNEDVCWIGIRDATANHGRTIHDTIQHCSWLGIENSSARLLPANTVCLSRTASVGYVIVMGREMATSQDFVNWVCSDALCFQFLKYVLLSENRSFLRFASGTTHQTIYFPEVKAFHICHPPVSEQRAIAHILGSLDDRIELNRRMNATLEGMAQALFKSWFVDFDPVIDNALVAGNPIPEELTARAELRRTAIENGTANRETAKLFPDAFIETGELGWIPEGWEVKKVANFIDITHGYAFKGEFFCDTETKDVLVTPGNFHIGGGFKSNKLKYYNGPVDVGYILNAGDLILTMTDLSKSGDTLGYPALVPHSEYVRYLHNQRIGRVIVKNYYLGKFYLNQLFRTDDYRNEILGSMTGSTVKHTSPTKIESFPFPFSGGEIESTLDAELQNFESRISQNDQQSHTLTKLRDTLLPKLISGELRIPDAEKLAEAALS